MNMDSLFYKNIPVKKKPWWMNLLLFKTARGAAFLGEIYLREDLFEKYQSGNPDAETLSILEHEKTHVERGRGGWIGRYLWYYVFPSVRFREELAAIESEMRVLKQHGQSFDIERRARNLSKVHYLWSASYEKAHRALSEMWQRV